jgi:hypothetical protein
LLCVPLRHFGGAADRHLVGGASRLSHA